MEKRENTFVIKLDNKIGELKKIQEALESLADRMDIPFNMIIPLNLVMEEAFTNIVNYAYLDEQPHSIEVSFLRNDGSLVVTIIDDGQPYDPTAKDDPDISLSAEERNIGGLGIFLIKKIMDKVEYRREDNKNVFILTKYIAQ